MKQPSTLLAAVRRSTVALAVVSLVACAKSDGTKDSAAARAAGESQARGTAAALSAAQPTAAKQPGDLPKPIDEMSGDELFTFTRTLSYGGGHERRRRCRGNPECRGGRPKDSTLVRIDAVEREDSLGTTGLAANGVIGARALNKGTLPDSMYNTRPGKDYEYYLIIQGAGPGVATWRLEELTTTAGSRSHHSVATGSFVGCNHPFKPGARADFKSCANAETRQVSFGLFQSDGEDPIWIGCSLGCCTAGSPDGRG